MQLEIKRNFSLIIAMAKLVLKFVPVFLIVLGVVNCKVYDKSKETVGRPAKPQPNLKEKLDEVFKSMDTENEDEDFVELLDIIRKQKYTPEEGEMIAKHLLDALVNSPDIWYEGYKRSLILEAFTKIRHPEAFKILKGIFMQLVEDEDSSYHYLCDALTFQDHQEAEKLFVSLIKKFEEEDEDGSAFHFLSEQLEKIAKMGELDTSTIQLLLSKIKQGRKPDNTWNMIWWAPVLASSKDPSAIQELKNLLFKKQGRFHFWDKFPIARALIEGIPEESIPEIQSYYNNNPDDIVTREAILSSLDSLPENYVGQPVWEICRHLIISGLTDPNPEIRAQAAEESCSEVLANETFIPYLEALLNDPSKEVSKYAKKSLKIIQRKIRKQKIKERK